MPRTESPIIKLGTAHEIAFAPAEDCVALVGNRDVSVFSLKQRESRFAVHPVAHPSDVDFAPDGRRLVVKSTSGRTFILDANTGRLITDFRNQNEGEGSSALFSICGRYVVSVSWNGLLSVRDAVTAEQAFAYSYDGCMLNDLSAPANRRFFIYSVGRQPPSSREPPPPETVILRPWPILNHDFCELSRRWSFITAMKVSPSGRLLGVIHGAPPKTLEVYDIHRSQIVAQCDWIFGGGGRSLGWSTDERLIAIDGKDRCLVLEMPMLKVRNSFPLKYSCFTAFSPSSRYLALGSWRKSFIVPVDYLAAFEGTS